MKRIGRISALLSVSVLMIMATSCARNPQAQNESASAKDLMEQAESGVGGPALLALYQDENGDYSTTVGGTSEKVDLSFLSDSTLTSQKAVQRDAISPKDSTKPCGAGNSCGMGNVCASGICYQNEAPVGASCGTNGIVSVSCATGLKCVNGLCANSGLSCAQASPTTKSCSLPGSDVLANLVAVLQLIGQGQLAQQILLQQTTLTINQIAQMVQALLGQLAQDQKEQLQQFIQANPIFGVLPGPPAPAH